MTETEEAVGAALVRDIIDDPAADDLRLIYADWCEEFGDPKRAELIRVQIDLDRLRPGPEDHRKAANMLRRYRKGAPVPLKARTPAVLLAREALLLTPANFWGWFGSGEWLARWPGSPAAHPAAPTSRTFQVGYYGGREDPENRWLVEVRRGFIGGVDLPGGQWLAWGDAVCRSCPIERVGLRCRQPGLEGRRDLPEFGRSFWACDHAAPAGAFNRVRNFALPRELFLLLGGGERSAGFEGRLGDLFYDTPVDAQADLSAACILYARGWRGCQDCSGSGVVAVAGERGPVPQACPACKGARRVRKAAP